MNNFRLDVSPAILNPLKTIREHFYLLHIGLAFLPDYLSKSQLDRFTYTECDVE